jgi:O6-methylguanine-DNA--protein-cysteine methyltransferase
MAKNFDENIPCHRVIRSDGSVGGYNRGGTPVKKQLLIDESAVL